MTITAGIAQCVIDPLPGVELGGYPYFERGNTGVHDSLVAGALYVNDGQGGVVLLIATDLFWITREQADSIRTEISRRTDVPQKNILITCSHTHSAPWMSVVFESAPGQEPFETKLDDGYIATVIERLVDIAQEAVSNTFFAAIGYAKAQCGKESGIGGNRRDPDNGVYDADLPALVVFDAEEHVRAVWTKYALHPTILHGENTLVSADFPGAMRSEFARSYPDALFLYSMGTAGDQSPRFFRTDQSFAEVERFGSVLGKALVAAVRSAQPTTQPTIRLSEMPVDLVVKEYEDPEVILAYVEKLRIREAELIKAEAPYTEQQTANLWLLGAECDYNNALQERDGRLLERYRLGEPYTVTALSIGGVSWVFLPGEIFADFGKEIRRDSPFCETNVVTLTNGQLPGYCVTQEALDEGGYEPGNSILAAASGHVMAKAAVELLIELAKVQA